MCVWATPFPLLEEQVSLGVGRWGISNLNISVNLSNQTAFLLTKSYLQLLTPLPHPHHHAEFWRRGKRGETIGTWGCGVLWRLMHPSAPCHRIVKDWDHSPLRNSRKHPALLSYQQLEGIFFNVTYSSPIPWSGDFTEVQPQLPIKIHLKNGIKRIKYLELNLTKKYKAYTLKITRYHLKKLKI